jgi:hypothetical protein
MNVKVYRQSTLIKSIVFLLVGIPGLALFLFATVELISAFYDPTVPHGNAAVSCLIGMAGMILMLIGIGEWGKWKYFIVFLSIPVSITGSVFLASFFDGAKLLPGIFVGVVTFATLHLVKNSKK